jgi:hypothetical protein
MLLVQWDGYVVDPSAWSAEFLQYDYLGAKWHWFTDGMTVGNGGFTLRSKRLLDLLASGRLAVDTSINEDVLICRVHRPVLERDYGICFAPESIADRFSYERSPPNGPTFGYHGLWNMWRHVSDAEMVELVELIAPGILSAIEYTELIAVYLRLRRWEPLRALYRRWKAAYSLDEIRNMLSRIGAPNEVEACLQICARLG